LTTNRRALGCLLEIAETLLLTLIILAFALVQQRVTNGRPEES